MDISEKLAQYQSMTGINNMRCAAVLGVTPTAITQYKKGGQAGGAVVALLDVLTTIKVFAPGVHDVIITSRIQKQPTGA